MLPRGPIRVVAVCVADTFLERCASVYGVRYGVRYMATPSLQCRLNALN